MRLSPRMVRPLVSGRTRIRLYQALAAHMDNGLSLLTTLALLRQRVPKGVWAQESLLDIAAERLRAGATLGEALADCVPDMEYMLLSAGDRAGRQTDTLRRVAELVRVRDAVLEAVRKALGYPLFLFVLFIGLLITVALFVVPAFLVLVEAPRWQGSALVLYEVTAFVASWKGLCVGLALLLLVVLVLFSLPRWTGSLRARADTLPPWSLYRLLVSSMWLFTLSTMLRGNIRAAEALEITRQGAASAWLARHLDEVCARFATGKDLGQALALADENFLEKDILHEFTLYAPLPGFADKLPGLAEQWLNVRVDDVTRACQRLNILCIIGILGLLTMVGLAVQDLVVMLSDGISLSP